MTKGMLALVACLTLTGCLQDLNGDGTYTVVCAGDSLTRINETHPKPKWCEVAAGLLPSARVRRGLYRWSTVPVSWVNVGYWGTTVCDPDNPWAFWAMPQLERARASRADVVFAAFGSNDVVRSEVDDIVACVRALVEAARPIPVIVALVPPTFPPDPTCTFCPPYVDRNAKIAALNARVLATFGRARTIDFHTGFAREHFNPDGLHLSPAGHALRARIAVETLRRR